MSSLVAAIQNMLNPLWLLMGERTWTCVLALSLFALVMALVGLPVLAALMTGVVALLLMWKAEHPFADR